MVGLWLLLWFGASQPIVHGWWVVGLVIAAIADAS